MKKTFFLIPVLLLIIASLQSSAQSNTVADTSQYPYWISMMQDPEANFFQTQSAFNKYWENRPITKGSGWKPFKRWEYMMQSRVSPEGKIPQPDKVLNEYTDFVKQNDKPASLTGNWESLGPFYMGGGYEGMGRVNAVAFHPTDPNTIYIGAPAGGLWITTNGGNDWQTTTDGLPTLGVSAIAIDPSNPSIIYIGTGDRDASDAPGLGVMKSIDNGLTWQASNNGLGNKIVGDLLIDNTNTQIIYAATTNGLFKSINGGATWVLKIGGGFKDIAFKPGNTSVIYATQGGKFYLSTDSGETWNNITSGIPAGTRGVIAVTAANPEIVYFLLSKSDNSFRGLYRSTDAGVTFTEMSAAPNIMGWDCNGGSGGQAWYDLALEADPVNADIIYAGGVNVWKSTNGGANWQISGHWYGGCGVSEVHADQHIMAANPLNNRIYLGNDGGVYYTINNGSTWNEISAGLVISQAYKLAQSATVDDMVINGYQDNGTSILEYDMWKSIGGGDGMECAIDPTNPNYRYTSVYYGAINRVIGYNSKNIAGNGTNGINEEGAWVTPYIISENDPNTMFIGYKNVWRSRNIKATNSSAVTWTKISTINTGNLSVLEQSPVNPDILYASSGSSLYISVNALQTSPTWLNISSQLPAGGEISSIETSPFEENTVYIIQDKEIYKSTNRGSTWVNISGNLPDIHFSSLVYYKNSIEGLYAGSDAGVYYKDKSMTDWILFSNGLPAAIKITELEIYYDPASPAGDRIKASTFGRGLWKSDMYQTIPTVDFKADKTIVPTDCPINFTDMSYGVPDQWNWSFPGGTPESSNVKNPTGIRYSTPGKYTVQLTASNGAGSNTSSKTDYIIVSDTLKPIAGFTASPRVTCDLNTIIQLSDTSKFCPVSWIWSISPSTYVFENGTNANSQNPQIRFTAIGNYSVTLQATNTNGSRSITLENLLVVGGYEAPFEEYFETNLLDSRGWEVSNPDNSVTWELTTVSGNTPGAKAVWMNFFNYSVPPGRRDRLISPPLNFSNTYPLFMTFEHAYANRFTTVSDSLIVLISDDCGTTWTRVFAAGEKGAGTLATVPKQTTPFTPVVDDDWCGGGWGSQCNVLDLTAWANKPGIKIAFESYNRNGNNLFIDNIKIAGTPNVSVKPSETKSIQVYPNPTHDYVTLYCNHPIENLTVKLISAQGTVIFDKKISSGSSLMETLNLKSITKGVYLLKISGNNTLQQEKIIIQ